MSIPTYDPSNEPSAQAGGGQQQQYGQPGVTQPPYSQPIYDQAAYDPNAQQQTHVQQQQPYAQQHQPYAQGYGQSPPQASNGVGIAALVVGILALFGSFIPFLGLVPGIAALVLGIIGRKRAKSGVASNGGMALAGIIMGAVNIVVGIGWIFLVIKYGSASYSVGTPS